MTRPEPDMTIIDLFEILWFLTAIAMLIGIGYLFYIYVL